MERKVNQVTHIQSNPADPLGNMLHLGQGSLDASPNPPVMFPFITILVGGVSNPGPHEC
jgi:hypothetical protein